MTNTEFVKMLKKAASKKTLYVYGCFGAPMNAANKERYCKNTDYNKKPERTKKIKAASADTFGFDCVCLIKGILWGWTGDKSKTYGGAGYQINGVPDIDCDSMMNKCKNISTDFSSIMVGEAVGIEGHIGVYVGDGLVIECTPKWDDGVQYTACLNIGSVSGYNGRKWTRHGKLPYVTYEGDPDKKQEEKTVTITLKELKRGATGDQVKTVQRILRSRGWKDRDGEKLKIDGSFGAKTEWALKKFQNKKGLMPDGVVGKKTWDKLLGVT